VSGILVVTKNFARLKNYISKHEKSIFGQMDRKTKKNSLKNIHKPIVIT
jgi:hypothetical protein